VADIEFHGGDSIVQPIQLMDRTGTITLSIVGCTISAVIVWRGRNRFVLTEGDGFEIDNLQPNADQPHLTFVITPDESIMFPKGRKAFIEFDIETSEGVRVSSQPIKFNRTI
jgi:hypothetical protein